MSSGCPFPTSTCSSSSITPLTPEGMHSPAASANLFRGNSNALRCALECRQQSTHDHGEYRGYNVASLLSACWLPWPRPRRPSWAGKVFARFEVSASAMNNTTQHRTHCCPCCCCCCCCGIAHSFQVGRTLAHQHTHTHTHPWTPAQPVGSA